VDGKTGCLVPYGDINGFADRIVEVLQNEVLRKTLTDGAVAWARKFNWDDSADSILRVIEGLIRKR
jgi:glycosyltransferase involved in cell wall biosynthesis